jgi:signal peptidase I
MSEESTFSFSAVLKKIYLFFLDTIQTILLAASVFLVIYIFLFRPFQVSGLSMFPTFQDKEYILTNLISLRTSPLKRGDVIVFHAPDDKEKDYIKRIIGLPGERVVLRAGDVYINDQKLDESQYLHGVKTYGGAFLRDEEETTVPDGEVLALGDNRPFSSDSRAWGFVKESEIIGKSFFVYFPFSDMHLVKNPYTAK